MLAVFVLFICSFNALIIISEMTDDSGNPIMFYMYEQDKCYVVNSIPQSEKIVKSDNGYQKNLYYSDSCEGEFTSTEVTDFTEGENSYIGSQFLDESDCKYSSSYQVLETYLSDKCHTYEGSYMKYEVHSNSLEWNFYSDSNCANEVYSNVLGDCNSCVNTENTYTYYTCKLDTYSSEESHSSEGFDQSSSYEEEESTFDQSSSNAGFDQSSSGENIDTSSSESSSIDDSSNSNTEINSNDNTESESNEDTNNVDGDSLKTIILVGISILVLII